MADPSLARRWAPCRSRRSPSRRCGPAEPTAWPVAPGSASSRWSAALTGLLVGGARLHAIDAGALTCAPGQQVAVDGFVAGVPRRNRRRGRRACRHAAGRRSWSSRRSRLATCRLGPRSRADGTSRDARAVAGRIPAAPGNRDDVADRPDRVASGTSRGLAGWIDEIRERAEKALGRGMPGGRPLWRADSSSARTTASTSGPATTSSARTSRTCSRSVART